MRDELTCLSIGAFDLVLSLEGALEYLDLRIAFMLKLVLSAGGKAILLMTSHSFRHFRQKRYCCFEKSVFEKSSIHSPFQKKKVFFLGKAQIIQKIKHFHRE